PLHESRFVGSTARVPPGLRTPGGAGYSHTMRCRLCGDSAGWFRRRCGDCRRLWEAWMQHRQEGMRRLLEALRATGASADKIDRFFAAEPRPGAGTIRDIVAAEMSNQLLAAIGQRPSQSGADAKRLRERGVWRDYDQKRDS